MNLRNSLTFSFGVRCGEIDFDHTRIKVIVACPLVILKLVIYSVKWVRDWGENRGKTWGCYEYFCREKEWLVRMGLRVKMILFGWNYLCLLKLLWNEDEIWFCFKWKVSMFCIVCDFGVVLKLLHVCTYVRTYVCMYVSCMVCMSHTLLVQLMLTLHFCLFWQSWCMWYDGECSRPGHTLFCRMSCIDDEVMVDIHDDDDGHKKGKMMST